MRFFLLVFNGNFIFLGKIFELGFISCFLSSHNLQEITDLLSGAFS